VSAVKKAVGTWLFLELGAVAVLVYLATRKKEPASPSTEAQTEPKLDPVTAMQEISRMPPELQARADALVLRLGSFSATGTWLAKAVTPEELAEADALATELDSEGYPQSAAVARRFIEAARAKSRVY
jgi:hypothetical protein